MRRSATSLRMEPISPSHVAGGFFDGEQIHVWLRFSCNNIGSLKEYQIGRDIGKGNTIFLLHRLLDGDINLNLSPKWWNW